MFLFLHLQNKNQAAWLVYDQGSITHRQDFPIERGQENILFHLDKLLQRSKLAVSNFIGFGLAVEESGLTQVKILTTIINIVGWQQQQPVAAVYYETGPLLLEKLSKKLNKQKKFVPLKPQYQRRPEITVSLKKNKFKIIK